MKSKIRIIKRSDFKYEYFSTKDWEVRMMTVKEKMKE